MAARRVPAEDRFAGSLVGQCLGDALGFVVEGYGPEECSSYVDGFLRGGHAGDLGRAPFPFGQYTDDSQLARELLQSLVERGGLDPSDYGRRVAAIFVEGRIVGRGRATEEAAQRLAAGVPWAKAGAPAPSAGNGSAMRAGPIGLWDFDDLAALCRDAKLQGQITHQDPRCAAGAIAIAAAVALALREGPVEPKSFCAEVAARASHSHAPFAAQIDALGAWADAATPAEALPRILESARLLGATPDGWRGISPFVVPSVLWSLYSFLRSPDDYWEVACTAIGVGGDVDTTAAMACAISGARVGLAGLPQKLLERLEDRGTWRLAELRALVHRCWLAKST